MDYHFSIYPEGDIQPQGLTIDTNRDIFKLDIMPVCLNDLQKIRPIALYLWWGKNILIAFFAFFFLLFGIEALMGSFLLKNPLEFIMYFFSASFIVLVSLVGILYSTLKIHALFKKRKYSNDAK
jgi:hypothetical protein